MAVDGNRKDDEFLYDNLVNDDVFDSELLAWTSLSQLCFSRFSLFLPVRSTLVLQEEMRQL